MGTPIEIPSVLRGTRPNLITLWSGLFRASSLLLPASFRLDRMPTPSIIVLKGVMTVPLSSRVCKPVRVVRPWCTPNLIRRSLIRVLCSDDRVLLRVL